MASGSKVAVANCSTYIQGCVSWDANATSSGIVVNVRFYMRRTNNYSGSTYSSDVSQYINISGDANAWNYSQRGAITVAGGQQNTWQGPYFSASRTFDSSRGGDTIYVGWKTVENYVSGYLGGSGSVAITLPTAYTAPSTPSISASANGVNAVNVTYGTSSFGNPSSGTVYLYGTASGSTSAITSKTSTGNSTYSHTGRTGNTRYYYRSRASNGQLWSSYSSEVSAVTLAPALSAKSASAASTTSITVSATTAADGGVYAKNIQYSLDNSTWTTGATVAAGTTAATNKTFTISGLTTGTAYTIYLRVNTSAGNTSSGSVSATTYKIPANATVSAANYGLSNAVTYGVTTFNTGPNPGVYLYGGTAASPTTQLTWKNTTGNATYTHSNLTGNTKYYYRARAKNDGGWSSYSSDATAITSPAAPTLAVAIASGQKQRKITLTINCPAQGSAATMTAYYTVNGGSAISAGTVGSGGSVTATITAEPQTSYTIVAYLTNSSGNSSTVSTTVTTGLPLYCRVSGSRKTVKKLYCSVNGQAKLVQHLYGSVNGQAKKIF